MVQIKVVQDLRKQKADLTYAIYFRLTEFRKSIYLSTGYSINQEHWDKQACKVVKSHPNAAVINANLSKRYFASARSITELYKSRCQVEIFFREIKQNLKEYLLSE